jgi:hypothetical protein
LLNFIFVRKLKIAILTIVVLGLALSLIFFLIGYLRPLSAGLRVESNPSSLVYIDSEYIGKTPVRLTRKPAEVVIKLVPDTFDAPMSPYETRITLIGGVDTVLRRDFAQNGDDSAGEIISFEKGPKNETSLAVVTIPDAVQIAINGETKGFAPYKTDDITQGEHLLVLSAPGYEERSIRVRTYVGYKLTALVYLAPSVGGEEDQGNGVEVVEEEEEEELAVEMVEILPTSTGFLRVRKEASTASEEVGRVQPGVQYELVEEDANIGWYKIIYEDENEGWISAQYANKVVMGTSPTATPSATSAQ